MTSDIEQQEMGEDKRTISPTYVRTNPNFM